MTNQTNKKRIALIIVISLLLLITALLWFGLTNKSDEQYQPMQGKPAPNFTVPALVDPAILIDQQIFTKHSWSLLNVWATWCTPCQQEHPFLIELQNQGVPIYGLNYRDTP